MLSRLTSLFLCEEALSWNRYTLPVHEVGKPSFLHVNHLGQNLSSVLFTIDVLALLKHLYSNCAFSIKKHNKHLFLWRETWLQNRVSPDIGWHPRPDLSLIRHNKIKPLLISSYNVRIYPYRLCQICQSFLEQMSLFVFCSSLSWCGIHSAQTFFILWWLRSIVLALCCYENIYNLLVRSIWGMDCGHH